MVICARSYVHASPPPRIFVFLFQIVDQDGKMDDVGMLEYESFTVEKLAAARAGPLTIRDMLITAVK
jgi:hypothetical protein